MGTELDSVIRTPHRGADSADAEQILIQRSVLFWVNNAEEQASMLVSHELVIKQLTKAHDAMQHSN